MQRYIVIACASFALGMFASPLRAQEVLAAPAAQTQQPAPDAALPAPAPQAEQLPPPPPFPPMPSARPSHRWVDMGDRHSSRSHHRARATHAKKRTHHASKRAAHKHKARPIHFSRKTIRNCHDMSYRQIMRHRYCRALMKQELAAAPKHKAKARKARHHHSARKHRR